MRVALGPDFDALDVYTEHTFAGGWLQRIYVFFDDPIWTYHQSPQIKKKRVKCYVLVILPKTLGEHSVCWSQAAVFSWRRTSRPRGVCVWMSGALSGQRRTAVSRRKLIFSEAFCITQQCHFFQIRVWIPDEKVSSLALCVDRLTLTHTEWLQWNSFLTVSLSSTLAGSGASSKQEQTRHWLVLVDVFDET